MIPVRGPVVGGLGPVRVAAVDAACGVVVAV